MFEGSLCAGIFVDTVMEIDLRDALLVVEVAKDRSSSAQASYSTNEKRCRCTHD